VTTRFVITARCQGGITEQCEAAVTATCKRHGVQTAIQDGGDPSPDFALHVMDDDAGHCIVTWCWIVVSGTDRAAELAAELRHCGMKIDIDSADDRDGWDKRMLEDLVADGWITLVQNEEKGDSDVVAVRH
jgi:hypothetical protein